MKNKDVEKHHSDFQEKFNKMFGTSENYKFVAVGYLSSDEKFKKGKVSVEFMVKLNEAWNRGLTLCSAGFHVCEFCEEGDKEMSCSEKVMIDKKKNIKYIFPKMIFHYIEKHNFKPSNDFIKFIMEVK